MTVTEVGWHNMRPERKRIESLQSGVWGFDDGQGWHAYTPEQLSLMLSESRLSVDLLAKAVERLSKESVGVSLY